MGSIWQKRMALIVAIIVVFSTLLAGCGGNGGTGATTEKKAETTQQSTAAAEATAEQLAPEKLIWYVHSFDGDQGDRAMVQDAINKYLKDKINIELQMNIIDLNSYDQKIKTIIASGEYFDMCWIATWCGDVIKQARSGAFTVLDDLMDQYAPKTKELLGKDFWDGSTIDGKHYAIPANKEKSKYFGWVYNDVLAKKYGFDMSTLKSYTDIEPMLKVIKEKEPNITPVAKKKSIADDISYRHTNYGNGIGQVKEDGTVVNTYATEEYKNAVTIARDWYNKGYFRKDVATADKEVENDITSGKIFAFFMNLKPYFESDYNVKANNPNVIYKQVRTTDYWIGNDDTRGSMQAISAKAKDPARALMFLEYVNNDKTVNNLLNFGIEGVHYKKAQGEHVELISGSKYNMSSVNWMFGNNFLNYLLPSDPDTKWQEYEDQNAKSKPAWDLGFLYDDSAVKAELAACTDIVNQYEGPLNWGAVDPVKYLKEFNDKLTAAGIDKIIKDKQDQFDKWKAGK